jgi:hypothetical protein
MKTDRNIYRSKCGTYRVRITRRPERDFYVGNIPTLERAQEIRDAYAASHPKSRKHLQPRLKVRRTFADRRREREALGLCPYCGTNKPKEGHVQCQDCLNVLRMCRQNKHDRIPAEIAMGKAA